MPSQQQINMMRMDISSIGESESDVERVNDMMRNHNAVWSDNEEYVIERLKRRKRRPPSDWQGNYEFVDLLN